MIKLLGILSILVAFVCYVGCCEKRASPGELFALSGIPGAHDLRKLQAGTSFNGSMFGAFVLGCGNVSGSVATEENFQISWAPKPNEYIYSSVPRSKTRVIVVDTVKVPRIVFIVDTSEAFVFWSDIQKTVVNPNHLLEKYYLQRMDLYITADMLAHEPCLPQL